MNSVKECSKGFFGLGAQPPRTIFGKVETNWLTASTRSKRHGTLKYRELEMKKLTRVVKTKHVLSTIAASLLLAPILANAGNLCEGLIVSGTLSGAKFCS